MMTDPVSDMLTRIRNAGRARHASIQCPASKLKLGLAKVLVEEGYLDSVSEETGDDGHPALRIELRYNRDGDMIIDGIKRVSRPSCRIYVAADEIPKVRNGLGTAVLSTPKGVVSDSTARTENVGGELMCEVW